MNILRPVHSVQSTRIINFLKLFNKKMSRKSIPFFIIQNNNNLSYFILVFCVKLYILEIKKIEMVAFFYTFFTFFIMLIYKGLKNGDASATYINVSQSLKYRKTTSDLLFRYNGNYIFFYIYWPLNLPIY